MDQDQCLSPDTLTDYLDGALDPGIKTVTEAHLLACDSCRKELARYMRIMAGKISSNETKVLQVVTDRWAETNAGRKVAERRGLGGGIRSFPVGWLFTLVAVLIAAVFFIPFVMNRSGTPKSGDAVVRLLLSEQTQRPFEARLADQPHRPFVQTRGIDEPGVSYDTLAAEMTRLAADSYQMGRFYLIQKDFARAIPYLEMASTQPGAPPGFHNDLGVAYMEASESRYASMAGDEFRRAIAEDPAFAPALFNLALMDERMGKLTDAEAELKKFLELDSASDWAAEARSKIQNISH